jgi:hypothetical protein
MTLANRRWRPQYNTSFYHCGMQKDKTSSKTAFGAGISGPSKDREPASWRWDKQELERQIKDLKKKNDELVAAQSPVDGKKTASKLAANKPAGDAKVMPSYNDALLIAYAKTFRKLRISGVFFSVISVPELYALFDYARLGLKCSMQNDATD